MPEQRPILLSLHPRHAEAILAGMKTAELRRRPPSQEPPYTAVLYATAPRRAVVGSVRVVEVLGRSPAALWTEVGQRSAVTRAEFDEYFNGRPSVYALLLSDASAIAPRPLHGHAPQAWRYLSPDTPGDEALIEIRSRQEYGCAVSVEQPGPMP